MMTDRIAASAVETARAALVEQVGEGAVGDHLGSVTEADGVTTESFGCTQPGYPGWHWAVTVAVAEGQDEITVDEVVLLPGGDAIIAPAWVPYRERIKPGDLSPGDLLPVEEDDPRLVPAYLTGDPGDESAGNAGDPAERQQLKLVVDELGLGRVRVLSLEGRDLAAQRWYDGDQGPDVPMAQSAPARCGSCGFLVQLAGGLAGSFGLCANGDANDDGRAVSFQHGCGAHSEAQLRKKQLPPPLPDHVFDSISRDDLEDF